MSRDSLILCRVIGDVLDPFTKTVALRISYCTHDLLINGREYRPSFVARRPRVEVGGTDFRTFYTLVMVDPDAPSPGNPSLREYVHWMVTDIPGTTAVNFGNEVLSYESPRPTIGIHSLVFVLFQQPGRRTVHAPQLRTNFCTRNFALQNSLGSPVAAMYFNCQRETGAGGRRVTQP